MSAPTSVVMPYTELRPVVLDAVTVAAQRIVQPVRYVWTGYSPFAYSQLVAGMWALGGSFVVVEHDVVPHELALEELRDCPHVWCGFTYTYPTHSAPLRDALGCVRFSEELIARCPLLGGAIAGTRWDSLADVVSGQLRHRGHRFHSHGRVQHAKTGAVRHEGDNASDPIRGETAPTATFGEVHGAYLADRTHPEGGAQQHG